MAGYCKTAILLGVSVAGLSVAGSALAQEQPQADAGGDIIVTARRVEERLQDVPISMTVFDQEQLAKRNIAVASDLGTYTPSLSVNQRFGSEKSSFSIRGFNQDLNTAPTVGVYFADVVGVRAQGGTTSGNTVGAGSFTDLQNVQVLKGPQGTLFGRNTTGGAVLLVPRKPSGDFGGSVEGTIGNYNQRRIQAALNVPLSDTFKIRLAADRNVSDGYMRNRSGIGARNFNDTNYVYGRLSVVANLTPDLENYMIAHYSRSDTNGYALRLALCDRDATFANSGFTRLVTATSACAQIDRQVARGDKMNDVEVNNPNPFVDIRTWQVINTTTWQASDDITLKNIASYGEYREKNSLALSSDNFFVAPQVGGLGLPVGAPYQYITGGHMPGFEAASESTFTEELQIQGVSLDDRLSWVVGGYLEFSRPLGWSAERYSIYTQCRNLETLDCSIPLGFGTISQNRAQYSFDNHGVFAQGTFKLTDQLAVTVGARYTFDKISGVTEGNRIILFSLPGGQIGQRQVCSDSLRFNVPDGPDADSNPDALPITNPQQCNFKAVNKSNRPTWLLNVDYKPNSDTLIYGKWARGYRQGGLNFVNVGLETWRPEEVDSFEVGAKLSFGGWASGYLNIAAFYNKLRDQQVFSLAQARPGTGASNISPIINSGRSTIKGLEVDGSARFFDSLELTLGYAYIDTKIQELVVPILPPNSPYLNPVVPIAQEGDPLTLTPKHKLSATLTYTFPLEEGMGDVSFGATYTHTSRHPANLAIPREVGILPSSDLLNLNFDWKSVFNSHVDLALFATNITNETYPVGVSTSWRGAGFDGLLLGRPRTYGLRLRWNFGQ